VNRLSEREQLVTDLIYLRKDLGLTIGRLSQASAVVDACGGRSERLDVIMTRLIAAIRSLPDDPNREALEAAYGLLLKTKDLETLDDRRKAYGRTIKRKPDTVADREQPAIEELANALLSSFYLGDLSLVRPEAVDDMRQLYRFGQETLLYIEAFDAMAAIVSALRQADTGPVYMWALANISNESHFTDMALWDFVHCHSTLQHVIADREASGFMRKRLPNLWWDQKLDRPFGLQSSDVVCAALSEAQDADDLGRRLRRSDEGSSFENNWRELLSAEGIEADPHGEQVGEREDLRVRLIVLCQFLAKVFPEETRPLEEMEGNYELIVYECLTLVGEYAAARSIPDDTHSVERMIRHVISRPPNHYIFGGQEICVL
jgi:hypothetical protein